MVVVLMTAYGDVSTAVNAIKSGATDFVLKPWQNEKLVATVTAALEPARLARRGRAPAHARARARRRGERRRATRGRQSAGDARSVRPRAPRRADRCERVDPRRERHRQGARRARAAPAVEARAAKSFMSVDLRRRAPRRCSRASCSATAKARSPTRATTAPGRFEPLRGGTLFLDEIGNLPLHVAGQAAARARAARSHAARQRPRRSPSTCGSSAATNRDLAASSCRGASFARTCSIGSTRWRSACRRCATARDDIAPLFEHFVDVYARKYNLPAKRLSRRGAEARSKRTAGPATCASCGTRSSARVIMSDAPTARRAGLSALRDAAARSTACSSTTTTSRPWSTA